MSETMRTFCPVHGSDSPGTTPQQQNRSSPPSADLGLSYSPQKRRSSMSLLLEENRHLREVLDFEEKLLPNTCYVPIPETPQKNCPFPEPQESPIPYTGKLRQYEKEWKWLENLQPMVPTAEFLQGTPDEQYLQEETPCADFLQGGTTGEEFLQEGIPCTGYRQEGAPCVEFPQEEPPCAEFPQTPSQKHISTPPTPPECSFSPRKPRSRKSIERDEARHRKRVIRFQEALIPVVRHIPIPDKEQSNCPFPEPDEGEMPYTGKLLPHEKDFKWLEELTPMVPTEEFLQKGKSYKLKKKKPSGLKSSCKAVPTPAPSKTIPLEQESCAPEGNRRLNEMTTAPCPVHGIPSVPEEQLIEIDSTPSPTCTTQTQTPWTSPSWKFDLLEPIPVKRESYEFPNVCPLHGKLCKPPENIKTEQLIDINSMPSPNTVQGLTPWTNPYEEFKLLKPTPYVPPPVQQQTKWSNDCPLHGNHNIRQDSKPEQLIDISSTPSSCTPAQVAPWTSPSWNFEPLVPKPATCSQNELQ